MLSPVGAQVVPNSLEDVSGSSNNGGMTGNFRPARFQQVYLGSEIDSGVISSIRFRRDEVADGGASSCTWTGASVVLSSTATAPDSLSATFAENFGPDATTVASGDLLMSSSDSTAEPRPFEFTIRLTTPFTFDSSSGLNLLVDITLPFQDDVFPCSAHPILDAHTSSGDSISMIACFNGSCNPTFDTATTITTSGSVTLFVHALFEDGFETGDLSSWSGP